MKSVFPQKAGWYKGVCHVHSTESDGWISPERVMAAYRDRGYDFVCITDHWKVTTPDKDACKGILHIPGVELHGGKTQVGDYHFVGIDVKKKAVFKFDKKKKYSPGELVKLIRSQGGLCVIAHPSWNGVSWWDLKDVAGDLFGLEVWNTGCDVEIGRGISEVQWDDLLSRGEKIWGLAVDDAHRYYRDAMKGWIVVKALSCTGKSIRKSLEKGWFYSSTGPSIYDLKVSKKRIWVKTSPVVRIDLVSRPCRGGTVQAHPGRYLEEHTFTLPGDDLGYVRIRIRDEKGQYAWTNPVYV